MLMRALLFFLVSAMVLGEEHASSKKIQIGDMASELLARSSSSSQVLSLNLSNLGILLLLKTLLFGAFYLTGDKYHKSRSLEAEELLSEQEVLLILSYLMGDADQDYSCLYRIACQDPSKSKQYLTAAKLLVKGARLMDGVIPFDSKYEKLVEELQDAINFGTKYGTCDQHYTCSNTKNTISNEPDS